MTDTQIPTHRVPDGATADDLPLQSETGVPMRSLVWSHHDTAKVSVQVSGFQYADDGRVEREFNLYGNDSIIDELTADDARQLARKLLEAADTLDDIIGGTE